MRFKAAILTEINAPLMVDEINFFKLDIGQVLVRVHVSGICGAQLAEISGAKGPDPWLPHLLGHEGGGIVEQVGIGVTGVKPGDHVVMHWRRGPGIEAKPASYEWGYTRVGAGPVTTFNELAVVSENRLTPIDSDIPFEVAALMGCAVTTALGMVNNEAKVRIGDSVVVAGCGGVGLNIIQGALLAGAWPVVGIDRSGEARARAVSLAGATAALVPGSDLCARLKDHVSDGGADIFVETTGSCEMIALGYDLIKPGTGRMVLVGQPRQEECLNIPRFRRHYQGKTVLDSQGGLTEPARDIPRYLDLYRAGKLPLEHFITHRFPLEQVNEAIEAIKAGGVGRCILTMP